MRRTFVVLALMASAVIWVQPARGFFWPTEAAKLQKALDSTDPAVRRAAAGAIVDLDPAVADPLLRKALADTDLDVRLAAARVAVEQRSRALAVVVIPWLSDADARMRLAACELVRVTGEPTALSALSRALGDPDSAVRVAAAAALGAGGSTEAVGPLLVHLDDSAPEVRAAVADALARIGDPAAAIPLIGRAGDFAPEVRKAVLRALGSLGDVRAATALVLAIRDPMAPVRVQAGIEALGKLAFEPAALSLAPLLEDREPPEVRSAALRALGRIGSEPAIRALVRALAGDDPHAPFSQVRQALASAGERALVPLLSAVSSFASENVSSGAALTLGAMRVPGAGPVIVDAMRRGTLGPEAALRALAMLGDPEPTTAVLEMLSDSHRSVRREAARALLSLMDPARHDGRAVEPLAAALLDARTTADERETLLLALGRTGVPRALPVLLPVARTGTTSARLAAISALGTLGPSGQDAALLSALRDGDARIRERAGVALASSAAAASVGMLLDLLGAAPSADRTSVGVGLSGALSRCADPKVVERIGATLPTVGGPVRDALIEGLGRMPVAAAGVLLSSVAVHATDAGDRAKIAEALAGHSREERALLLLLSDPEASVRAQAAWSAAVFRGQAVVEALSQRIDDASVDVAANAVGGLALIGRAADDAGKARVVDRLCRAMQDRRAYVRANALVGLSLIGRRCADPASARDVLARDRSDAVRRAAAALLVRAKGREATLDDRALRRCVDDDPSGAVANACREAWTVPTSTSPLLVFVVPDGATQPVPQALFALLRSDGLIRSGVSDRRGALFEAAAPAGQVRLLVPGALVF